VVFKLHKQAAEYLQTPTCIIVPLYGLNAIDAFIDLGEGKEEVSA
jgi:hypothetical protein